MAIRLTFNHLIDIDEDITNRSKNPISTVGGFGYVYRGTFIRRHHHRENELIDCAIKIMRYRGELSDNFESFHRELQSQLRVKHPALLPLLGFSISPQREEKLAIITPFMPNGSLRTILSNEKRGDAPLEWDDKKRIITIIGIAAGLYKMHQENLIHRDIKPENILFDEEFHPKICDFGLSKVFKDGLDEIVQATICGTEKYMAPEMIEEKGYNSKVDVFAFGLVLYEIFTNETFYERLAREGKSYFTVLANGLRPDLTDDVRFNPFFKKLIEECWSNSPDGRPSFEEILNRLLEAYKSDGLGSKDPEINYYILDVVGCLGFDVSFLS